MSEAAPNAFHSVVADRDLVRRPLILSLLGSVLAALLIIAAIVAAAGLLNLLPIVRHAEALTWPSTLWRQLLQQERWLQNPDLAMAVLTIVLVGLMLARSVLRSLIHGQLARHVTQSVNRLREHLLRQAMRCNPGDLTGVQKQTVRRLFQETAGELERAALNWSFRRLTTIPDLFALLVVLFSIQWRVSLECVIPVIVCWWASRIEAERHEASTNLLTEQVDRELEKLAGHLDKARIIAGYGMESLEYEQFRQELSSYQERLEQLRRQQRRGRWVAHSIVAIMVALPAFILARHLASGRVLDVAGAVSIGICVAWLTVCLRRLQNVPAFHGAATVAADAINQYLLRTPAVRQVVGARFLEPMSRLLQFDQVCVETETDPDLLSNLDLKIECGQRVAVVSLNPTASLALTSLIPRFLDPVRGQVLIDGQDIRRVTLESLRAEVVFVGGDEPTFSGTVLENVIAGKSDLSRQDAIEACKVTHAESFIRQLPKGYETRLSEQSGLDAGQRFRLSLARAIARDPALLIIQEPEAALDQEAKAMLDDTYQRICHGRTVIFLPSRLSTVKKCSRIVVLHEGKVQVDGTHDQLVRSSEIYRHWEYQKFSTIR